jgi:hypothetical protein
MDVFSGAANFPSSHLFNYSGGTGEVKRSRRILRGVAAHEAQLYSQHPNGSSTINGTSGAGIMADATTTPFGWERTALAVEKVKDRLWRAAAALRQAGVAYAVAGGNAVAEWVGRVDEAAVRNTRDVDILIRRTDLERAKTALEAAGFVYYRVLDVDMFLDGPNGRPKDAVHVLYAGEKVQPDYVTPAPDVADSAPGAHFQVVSLVALVQMKLNSFRLKDQVHLLDMIGVGLIDGSWPQRLPPELAARLQQLLDNPDG